MDELDEQRTVEVEQALYRSALSGNMTAISFWLRNRMPERWNGKPKPKEDDGAVIASTGDGDA